MSFLTQENLTFVEIYLELKSSKKKALHQFRISKLFLALKINILFIKPQLVVFAHKCYQNVFVFFFVFS